MKEYLCKMCGATLNVSDRLTVCECDYCGTAQTVSRQMDEIQINMFNRANNLRLKSDFDRAYAQYEQLVLTCPDDPESYWGLILSKFGVEYVKDPANGKMIPTLHRTQVEPVLTDPDYQSVLEYADDSQSVVYKREAEQIDKLQKEVMEVVQHESPYDVFICYKETDENGVRTQDSVIANDIYHQLTHEGWKVFYAAITLEDKLGHEYEPYIYAALHSAKVMLVIGTRPEYFEAVWVRNEWSRYLKIVQEDRKKLLIPCYRDMNPYDLPEDFSHLQAQDMSKIGFISDIINGVRKVLSLQTAEKEPQGPVVTGTNRKIENMLKRAYLALEDGEWIEARLCFNRIIKENYKDYRAYIGLLLEFNNISREEDLILVGDRIASQGFYEDACKYGGKEVEARLSGYVKRFDPKLVQYTDAVKRLQKTETEYDYRILADNFRLLGDYKDSAQKADECICLAQAAKEKEEREYLDRLRNCKTGDTVKFGNYEWVVIKQSDDVKTLLSKGIIGSMRFNNEISKNKWDKSDIRKWLNGEFYNEFSEEEKKLICKTRVETPDNPRSHKNGGKPTEDYVFLISIQEAWRVDEDVLYLDSSWWLRSAGAIEYDIAAVSDNEYFSYDGYSSEYSRGVRPAINIKV